MSDRMSKVNSTLREVLAEEIERMSDSRLEMVSVTAVDTAPNLRHAVVYVDVLDTEGQEPALAALRGAARRLQGVIGAEVRMKYTPTLEFAIDPGITGGERIDRILRDLQDDRSEAPAGGGERSELGAVSDRDDRSEATAGGGERGELGAVSDRDDRSEATAGGGERSELDAVSDKDDRSEAPAGGGERSERRGVVPPHSQAGEEE